MADDLRCAAAPFLPAPALQDAAERCTASMPPPSSLDPSCRIAAAWSAAGPPPASPGMEATLLPRCLEAPCSPAPAAARPTELREGIGARWLLLRLAPGLMLPFLLTRGEVVLPDRWAVRLGRLLTALEKLIEAPWEWKAGMRSPSPCTAASTGDSLLGGIMWQQAPTSREREGQGP